MKRGFKMSFFQTRMSYLSSESLRRSFGRSLFGNKFTFWGWWEVGSTPIWKKFTFDIFFDPSLTNTHSPPPPFSLMIYPSLWQPLLSCLLYVIYFAFSLMILPSVWYYLVVLFHDDIFLPIFLVISPSQWLYIFLLPQPHLLPPAWSRTGLLLQSPPVKEHQQHWKHLKTTLSAIALLQSVDCLTRMAPDTTPTSTRRSSDDSESKI